MGDSELFLDRQCHKCHEKFNVSSAALRLHVGFCKGPTTGAVIVGQADALPSLRAPRQRVTSMAAKISNRKRQRFAMEAITRMLEMKTLLIGVLAQKGGEVTITQGTISQVTPDMDFEVVVNPAEETERIVRIVK